MKAAEPIEVDVSAIHDVDGTGLGQQRIENIGVMQLAVADEDEGRDIAPQIQERVQLDRRFGRAERRPGKDREAQIDRGGIERVDGVLEIEPKRLVGVKSPGCADQALRQVAVDAPIPRRVGIGQRVARHGAAKSQVIEFGTLHTQTRFDVAALAIGQLREGHAEVLVETREPLDLVLAGIAHDAAVKRVQRQMFHHLREHELAQVHRYLPRAARPQDGPVSRRRRGSNRQLDERSLPNCFSMAYVMQR